MNDTYKAVLENHKKRVEGFISAYESVLAENMRLKERLADAEILAERLQKEKNDYDNKIKELEERIDNLQIAGAFVSSAEDVKEAKRNINRLAREVEKCISLLND